MEASEDPGLEKEDSGHDYEAREEHVAKGPRPEDIGGTENAQANPDREHPGDTPGGG